jgi:DNA polymerase I-like protein with 3'-5' exonuclease and polymerase domains
MKQASVILDDDKHEANLDAWKVIDYHDEQVNDVIDAHVEPFMDVAVQSIIKAGICYDLRIPLDADAKRGNSWAEIH